MNKIIQFKTNKIIVQKSKFISFVFNINSFDEFKLILNDLKKQYHDAKHICYAYRFLDENKKEQIAIYESTEPKNSSGIQIFNVIKKNDLFNILVIVVRYFGGIKLGVKLLQKSYYLSTELLLENNIENYVFLNKKEIKISYENLNKVLKICADNNIKIVSKQILNFFVFLQIEYENNYECLKMFIIN